MRIVRKTPWDLHMRSSRLFTKIWSFGMFTFCTFGLLLVSRDYNEKLFPVIIICSVMMVVALLVFLFMNKTLEYVLDKKQDKAVVLYPAGIASKHDKTSFKISDLKHIKFKGAIGFSSQSSRSYSSLGFDFVLHTGRKIHGGIYSSSHKKIKGIVAELSNFLEAPVVEKDGKTEILF